MSKPVSILFTGDLYGGGRVEALTRSENYALIFNDFLPVLKGCDLAVTNLEAPLTNADQQIIKSGPAIKSTPKLAEVLNYGGFGLVTLANNHIMDFGTDGLSDTMAVLKKNQIDCVGAGMNLKEASKTHIRSIHGKTLAFVNIAENEWASAERDKPGAHPLDPLQNYQLIEQARTKADYVFLILHGGHEMYSYPSPRMVKTYRLFAKAGADVIISHHAHFMSGYENFEGTPIFYGLGNFLFDNPGIKDPRWNFGYAVKVNIDENGLSCTQIPYIQNAENAGLFQLSSDEKASFHQNIEELNAVISDEQLLNEKFIEYCSSVQNMYQSFLEPHSIRVLHALRNRGLFPFLLRKKKRVLLKNLIRCESHRDVINAILEVEK